LEKDGFLTINLGHLYRSQETSGSSTKNREQNFERELQEDTGIPENWWDYQL
jgi:hypothetical protein